MGGTERRTVFFEPITELRAVVEFGFALDSYRRRGEGLIRRLPTARGTVYFAAHVRGPTLGERDVGLYCEGPHATAFTVEHESEAIVALKVRPGGLGALLGVAANAVRNRTIDLADLWGVSASAIAHRVAEASSTADRIKLLQKELAARCRAEGLGTTDALHGAALIARSAGRIRIDEVSHRSGLSQRTMAQRFDAGVGLTPKQYARLVRLRATMSRMVMQGFANCSDLALAFGYVDQAHMIHEFRALIGLSPLEFRRALASFSPLGAAATGSSAVPRCERALYHSVGFVDRWVRARASRDLRDPADLPFGPPSAP